MTLRSRITAAATAVAILCAYSVSAADAATLEQQASQAKQRIQQVSKSLTAGREQLDAAEAESDAAAAEEAELSGLIAAGAERSAELRGQVAESERELARSRKRLERAREMLSDRLVAIYMNGTPDVVEIALGAASFDDLAAQQEYLVAVQDADVRLAERVRSVRNQLEGQTAKLTALKGEVDQHNAELASARSGIVSARQAAEATAARLASVTSERQAEIGSLKSDIAGWQKEIERREAAPPEEAEQQVDSQLGGPYSIPTYIVMCESGGNYSAVNPSSGAGGAYQILPSTWEAYGGKGLPNEASKAEQDRIAALIWADSGGSAWVCAG